MAGKPAAEKGVANPPTLEEIPEESMQKPAVNHPSHQTGLQRTHLMDNFPGRVLVMIDKTQRELTQVRLGQANMRDDIHKCKLGGLTPNYPQVASRAARCTQERTHSNVRAHEQIKYHFQHVDRTLKKFDTVLAAFTASAQRKQDFRDVARVQKTQAQELAGLRETIGMLERGAEGHRKMVAAVDADRLTEDGHATGEATGEVKGR